MGHYASMCSIKVEGQQTLSKRQRSLSKRRCFGCYKKGHQIATYPCKSKMLPGKSRSSEFASATSLQAEQRFQESSEKVLGEEGYQKP
jgi:hypothetical protein